MKKNHAKSDWTGIPKSAVIATAVASFLVFGATFFALAENKNSNSVFLDSDQDGLTDQEEKAIGTDPGKFDTDGDGYSDGKEIESGYNPLKPAPGDRIMPNFSSLSKNQNPSEESAFENSLAELSSVGTGEYDGQLLAELSSDPQNPNLTNEMIGQFMQLTLDKNSQSEDFLNNPSFSQEELDQVIQTALQTADISGEMPEISDSEIKILPPIDEEGLSSEEMKEKQKQEIQKYLASVAFIVASNSPFPINNTGEVQSSLTAESENFFAALVAGDQEKINDYAQKAEAGLEQTKQVEVPHILKDFHKSVLELAAYSLSFKDSVAVGGDDPMKSLAALGSLQAVGESALKLQGELTNVLAEYGIEFVEMNSEQKK